MKIRKVRWKDHKVLGNLEIDFTDASTGQPFETIVFAGENGVGKTTVLETISTFLNLGTFEHFDFIEYSIGARNYKAVAAADGAGPKTFFDVIDDTGVTHNIRSDKSNNPDKVKSTVFDLRNVGCVFSKARADYKTQQITTTTTKKLDLEKHDLDSEDDFTSLKQLLVDIHNQDNADYVEENKKLGTKPKAWPDYYPTSKIFRFKNSFDNFFEKIKYESVQDGTGEKRILFNKNGKDVPIDNLSTGEKQIVFRGCFLLRNNKNLDGAAIMIDEPELSMHPKWQKKILKYFVDLFSEGNRQKVQLFIGTHSEYVLKSALSEKLKNLVIVLNEVNGAIVAKRIDAPSVLPTITGAETNYVAFDVVSNDYHIELYGHLQNKNVITAVKSCDDFIKGSPKYNSRLHHKASSFKTTTYETLCTYIRNAIDHPSPTATFTEEELRASTELLIELCR